MGRGNVRVTEPCEGLYYVDYADLHYYRNIDTDETRLLRDISIDDMRSGRWEIDESLSDREERDAIRLFSDKFTKAFPSFHELSEHTCRCSHFCKYILESDLFLICVEDNEWSIAIELIQKDGCSDCQQAWLFGLQKRYYRRYLDEMKKILLEQYESIGIYSGPWTSGIITREEESKK